MRIVGVSTVVAAGLGLALLGATAGISVAQEAAAPATGPLILTPDPAPATPAAPATEAGPVAAVVPPPAPAVPAPDAGSDSDEPRTTGIDDDPVPPAATPVPAPASAGLPAGATLEGALGLDVARLGTTAFDRASVERFYSTVGVAPQWTGAGRFASFVPALTDLFAHAGDEGLDARSYPLAVLAGLQADGATGTFEALFTDTVLRYAADRAGARLATVRLPADMREVGHAVDPVAVTVAALAGSDPVAGLASIGPQDDEYRALKRLLAEYRAIAAAGGWPMVEVGGPKITPGAVDARIVAIRARLAVTDGAATEAARPNHYDPALLEAVKRFQLRHGLKPDGVIGKETLADMATPVETRIGQILVNLERRRQQLDDLGATRIVVNIPEFTLRYFEEGTLAFTTPVVIGRLQRKTPLLQSKVSNVVLNPPWSVPARNAGEDIVRKQINDPNYLTAHGYTVYADGQPVDPATIDWSQMPRSKAFPYRLRQSPGAGNSLGRLKINFQNDYAVYMHDTPEKELFVRDIRAYSSGCVRVKDPFTLGAHLLRDVPGWDRARMDATVASTTTTIFINVVHSIGVRITYVTAWVDADGNAQFRDDLYGIDARIQKGLGRPVMLADGI